MRVQSRHEKRYAGWGSRWDERWSLGVCQGAAMSHRAHLWTETQWLCLNLLASKLRYISRILW